MTVSSPSTDRRHVLFVSQEYPPGPPVGGVGTYTHALARALADQGCRVTVISCGSQSEPGVTVEDGVTIHRIRIHRRSRVINRLSRLLPRTAERLALARAAARATRRLGLRPDVVEAPEWGAEGLLMRRAARAPVIVHLHSPMYTLLQRRGLTLTLDERLAAGLERLAARRADLVTAGAGAANEVLPGRQWIDPARIRVTPMPAAERLLTAPVGAWPREPLLVACGRLDRLKAPEVLVDAAAQITADFPNLRVVLIGEADRRDAPAYADYGVWVAERARGLGVTVELPGRLPWHEVIDYYAKATAVVVPSRYESFSMVAVEAMSCGTPVVVTSGCGIAEHLTRLGDGWVVPVDDPAALAGALRPLLRSQDIAASRGAAARRFAAERFGPGVAARARLSLYESMRTS